MGADLRRLVVVLGLAAGGLLAAAPALADESVSFGGSIGLKYSPDHVVIAPGSSVTWTGSFTTHPLTSASSESFADLVPTDPSYTHTFATAGIYRYYCAMHGSMTGPNQVAGMSGEVVVSNDHAPTAQITTTTPTVAPGSTVTFDASGSSDPDSGDSITDYKWDLDGNGSFETDTHADPHASAPFANTGTSSRSVTVKVEVFDNNATTEPAVGAQSSTASQVITVNGTPAAGGGGAGGGDTGGAGGTGGSGGTGGTGGDGGGGAGGGGSTGAGTSPSVSLTVPSSAHRSSLLSSGRLSITVKSSAAGAVRATLTAGGHTLATASGSAKNGSTTLHVKLTKAGRAALRRARHALHATLKVVVTTSGGATRTVTHAVRLT